MTLPDDDVESFTLKYPVAHALVVMLRPELPSDSSKGDNAALVLEFDDLPILESNRTSCSTPQGPVLLVASTADEPVDRLGATLPQGELHVWVYEARHLSASWSISDAVYGKHGLRVRCALFGTVQESSANIAGDKKNPVWRLGDGRARDGLGGHFAWTLGKPEKIMAGDRTVEAMECKLEIDVVCGEHVVGSVCVALDDLLRTLKARSWEESARNATDAKVIRLNPHLLPLDGNNAGLLQMSLEFIPASPHMLRDATKRIDRFNARNSGSKLPEDDDEVDTDQSNAEINEYTIEQAETLEAQFRREFVESLHAMSWLDQHYDTIQENAEDENGSNRKVIISRNAGVTMYIPTHKESAPSKLKHVQSPSLASKSFPPSFYLPSGAERDERIDSQLRDLYHFGISSEALETSDAKDWEDFTRTESIASDMSGGYSDLTCRSGTSIDSRHASTCASDVLGYNELIRDMESAMGLLKDTRSRTSSSVSNHEQDEREKQSKKATTKGKSPLKSKLHFKIHGMRKSTLNLGKPLDRIHSLWNEAKARASNSNNEYNGGVSTKASKPGDRYSSSGNNSSTAPRSRSRTPSSSDGEGVVLFDPENLLDRVPYQRSTSRDKALQAATKAERKRRAAATGPRRRSLPINSFSLHYRQENLCPQHEKKRSPRQQFEARLELQPSLLQSVDPPLLSCARSGSLHSLSDLHLPTTGNMYGPQNSTPTAKTTNLALSPANRREGKEMTGQRYSGSHVVYVNDAPLCVGKLVNVGNVSGVVRYIGTTRFATGMWVGIELCEKKGKNSGTIDGETYFSCAPNHGIFIRASRLGLSLQ